MLILFDQDTPRTGSLAEHTVQEEKAGPEQSNQRRMAEHASRSLPRLIATDLHFWIPLIVLMAGLFLLDKLR